MKILKMQSSFFFDKKGFQIGTKPVYLNFFKKNWKQIKISKDRVTHIRVSLKHGINQRNKYSAGMHSGGISVF